MAVAKVIEISASSEESFEDAIRAGLAKAGDFRVNMRVTFVLD